MGFVYEELTDEIIAERDLTNLFPKGWKTPKWNSWIIDKERDIWLFKAYSDEDISRYAGCEPSDHVFWGFFWEGRTYTIRVDIRGTEEDCILREQGMTRNELIFVRRVDALTYKGIFPLQDIKGYTFPPDAIGREDEFFKDLKKAFYVQDVEIYNSNIYINTLVFSIENWEV